MTVTVMDAAGLKATSNALYFEVFGTNEKLEDHLKVENARKMYDGKYIWDMSPWIINEFTHDSSQTVTVPKDIKAWYGSNTTGVYGKLGQPVLQGEPTKHTLIIPSGANLTMVNMISNSSVRMIDTTVVVMRGNININGNVFIRGDESATDEYNGRKVGGQPALKIENGKVNITKGSV